MSRGDAPRAGDEREPPPVLGRWRNLYLLVAGELLALVVLFYALTRWAGS